MSSLKFKGMLQPLFADRWGKDVFAAVAPSMIPGGVPCVLPASSCLERVEALVRLVQTESNGEISHSWECIPLTAKVVNHDIELTASWGPPPAGSIATVIGFVAYWRDGEQTHSMFPDDQHVAIDSLIQLDLHLRWGYGL